MACATPAERAWARRVVASRHLLPAPSPLRRQLPPRPHSTVPMPLSPREQEVLAGRIRGVAASRRRAATPELDLRRMVEKASDASTAGAVGGSRASAGTPRGEPGARVRWPATAAERQRGEVARLLHEQHERMSAAGTLPQNAVAAAAAAGRPLSRHEPHHRCHAVSHRRGMRHEGDAPVSPRTPPPGAHAFVTGGVHRLRRRAPAATPPPQPHPRKRPRPRKRRRPTPRPTPRSDNGIEAGSARVYFSNNK